MARNESDREDLLRQATALVERAELSLPGLPEPVVIGFRKGGSASFYFGADPVYQFNAAGELRRAYLGGLLYKAERGGLWRMQRERSAGEVALVSTCLDGFQADRILDELQARLCELAAALNSGEYTINGEVPPSGGVVHRVQHWLAALPAKISIASQPHAG